MITIQRLSDRLRVIEDELEQEDQLICAAHLQFVVDKLQMSAEKSMP